MKKILLLFLIFALMAMAGCSLILPNGSQGGSKNDPPAIYVVRFVPNGAPLINSVKVYDGETVPKPEDPVLEGKIFDGWYADPELTIEWDFESDVVIGDTKLYAKWLDGHTHSYKQEITAPTCTEGGFTTFTCSCGDKYVGEKVDPLGHEYVLTLVDPTCTESGYSLHKCERCADEYKSDPTSAKGHQPVADPEVEPTCTTTGLTEGSHCRDCKVVLTEQIEISATGHSYGSVSADPTCTADGTITYTCSACRDTYTVAGAAALGHDVIIDASKAPECTSAGLTEGSHCGRCGVTLVAQTVVAAKGHTHAAIPSVAPDCINSGLTAGVKCSDCGEIIVAQNEISALGHKSVKVPGAPATCSQPGLTDGEKCSVCGEILVEQSAIDMIPHTPGAPAGCTTDQVCTVCNEVLVGALGHTPVEGSYCDDAEYCRTCGEVFSGFAHTIIPATCTEPEKCKNCPYVGADALGHEYEAIVKEPTCTAAGYTHYLCVRCDDTNGNKKDNVVAKLGHDYYEMIIESTCTEEGRTTRNCHRCDVSTVTSTTPALGHAYMTASVVEPTCTAHGYTVYTCENCSDSYQDKIQPAKGHNEKKVITPASCTADGYTTYTCTSCGNVRIDDITVALGHDYNDVIVAPTCTDEGYTEHTCKRCNYTYKDAEIAPVGHNYVANKVDPTCSKQGYTEYKCSGCKDSYRTDYIDTVSHTYNGGAYCVECGAGNPDAIKITYVLNGAENDPANLEYFMKGTVNTLYDPLSREGYEFRGWYLDAECTVQITSLEGITEDITLYSKWVRVYHGNYDDGVETPDVPF